MSLVKNGSILEVSVLFSLYPCISSYYINHPHESKSKIYHLYLKYEITCLYTYGSFFLFKIAMWQPTYHWMPWNVHCQKRTENSLLKILSQYFSEFDIYFAPSYFHVFSCCCCVPISWKDPEEYRVPLRPRGKMPAKNVELLVKVTNYYKMDQVQ